MKVAVKDANVLIDLVEGDLLGLWFRLGIETHVPDLVLEEIKNPEQRRIVMAMVEEGNLRVGRFDPTQVLRIDFYKRQYRVSLADAAAILLAEQLQATLLSGDKLVRKGGQSLNLDVRGLLWVFDELLHRELLGAADAAARLNRVVEAGARLPSDEVQARLRKWRAG
jgi:predicted nucleic acid-binding protein